LPCSFVPPIEGLCRCERNEALATGKFSKDSASLIMPMSKEECGGHRTNVIAAFGHERDECIPSFVSKSPKTLKRSDVALRMLVSGRRVSEAHGIRLRFYVLSELLN
jgi:hypothetical protein